MKINCTAQALLDAFRAGGHHELKICCKCGTIITNPQLPGEMERCASCGDLK